MKTIEQLVGDLVTAREDADYTKEVVANLEESRNHHRSEALQADAELVAAYPDRDAAEKRVRDLESQLIAAYGEPS